MDTNKFFNYQNCSKEIKQQLNDVVNTLQLSLKTNLLGVYLNGSMVLNSFDEKRSDIDMIGVINNFLSAEEKIELGSLLLTLHQKPCPLEILLIAKEHLIPWQYPPICHFYFSDYFIEQYKQFLLGENLTHRLLTINSNTLNITSSVKLTKEKGVCLYGMAINDLFPDIPDHDFWDAISSNALGYDPASDNEVHRPFAILQLCRILSYRETRELLSKYEAATWAINTLPVKFQPIISDALYEKYRIGEKRLYTIHDALLFKEYILDRIV
jgi:hypothetical protein